MPILPPSPAASSEDASPIPVAILILPSVVPFDLAVPMQVFGYPRPDLGMKRYRATLCAPTAGAIPSSAGFTINVRHGLAALSRAHTIVLPGIDDLDLAIPPSVCRALQRAAARGARLVSVCTGAFVLAEAGLLDGRRATTHWMDAPVLASRYPAVTVDPDVLYVDEGQVLTSAGIACGIDLCLHVVRMDYGSAVAAAVAKRMVVAPHRDGSQAQFIVKPTVGSQTDTLEPTRKWARSQLAQPITVSSMVAHAKMPSRTFARRFQEEVGTSPLKWLVGERLLLARELLETTRWPLSQVASRAGFGTELSLRSHFRARLHTTPAAYRRAFRHQATTA